MTTVTLPPLPEHSWSHNGTCAYSKQVMREYGEVCARAALDSVVDEIRYSDPIPAEVGDVNNYQRAINDVLEIIRALAVGSGGSGG